MSRLKKSDGWVSTDDVARLSEHIVAVEVKVIPHATWLKLLAWCHNMAGVHCRDLLTLNCDDELNEILAEVEE